MVPVCDAGGRRVVAYARIDPRSEWVRAYSWYRLTPDGEAVTLSHPLGRGRPTSMAQVVLRLAGRDDVTVRHRNGDLFDNRIANLEAVDEPAPADEVAKRSRYPRVLWDAARNDWVAWGYSAGRYVEVGRFEDELAAARAARSWAAENQSIHLEDDYRVGGFGRALGAPKEPRRDVQ